MKNLTQQKNKSNMWHVNTWRKLITVFYQVLMKVMKKVIIVLGSSLWVSKTEQNITRNCILQQVAIVTLKKNWVHYISFILQPFQEAKYMKNRLSA